MAEYGAVRRAWAAWIAVMVGVAFAPRLVWAQGSAAPSATKARGTVVVVADVAKDMTDNAKIRARVYEVARKRGFEADRKADVQGAAERSGAMEAGTISKDDSKLGPLRSALGATVLIRIAREWEQPAKLGVKVSVIGESGAQSKIIEAPAGALAEPIEITVSELLDAAAPSAQLAPAASTPAAPSTPAGPADDKPREGWLVFSGQSNVQEEPRTLEDAKTRRQAWERRGGFRPTYEARALVTGIRIADIEYSDTNPVTDEVETGSGDALGIGGGIALRGGFMVLPLTDPTTSEGKVFAAFRMGIGGDLSFVFVRRPIGFTYENAGTGQGKRSEDQENETLFFGNVPLQVGLHFGFGRFHTNSKWRGVVLGLAYTPTYTFELNLDRAFGGDEEGGRKSHSRFNYGGAEVMLDITSIEAKVASAEPEPQIRIAAQVLPPLEDDWPLQLTLGLGVAWY